MASSFRFLMLLVAAGFIAAPIYRGTRSRAEQSGPARLRLTIFSTMGLALGLGLALWLPPRIPETNGSPASLVAVALLWVIGGGIAFLAAAALLGAVLAKPGSSAKDLST